MDHDDKWDLLSAFPFILRVHLLIEKSSEYDNLKLKQPAVTPYQLDGSQQGPAASITATVNSMATLSAGNLESSDADTLFPGHG
jgi:hypothetical protein